MDNPSSYYWHFIIHTEFHVVGPDKCQVAQRSTVDKGLQNSLGISAYATTSSIVVGRFFSLLVFLVVLHSRVVASGYLYCSYLLTGLAKGYARNPFKK
jgi:hypothetical protein